MPVGTEEYCEKFSVIIFGAWPEIRIGNLQNVSEKRRSLRRVAQRCAEELENIEKQILFHWSIRISPYISDENRKCLVFSCVVLAVGCH